MKKILPFFLAIFLFSSCQKDPDLSDLDGNFVAYTNYDKSANFSSYTTYYLPDSVMIIGGGDTQSNFWKKSDNVNAQQILSTIEQNMNSRGFTLTTDKDAADLGVQTTFIRDVSYFVDYYDNPYWWWGYPYYWDAGYWGWWDGWYYPYPVVFSYSVGSLLTEVVDLKNAPATSGSKLNVLWTSYDGGLLSGSAEIDTQLTVNALNQSFVQSPYLKK